MRSTRVQPAVSSLPPAEDVPNLEHGGGRTLSLFSNSAVEAHGSKTCASQPKVRRNGDDPLQPTARHRA